MQKTCKILSSIGSRILSRYAIKNFQSLLVLSFFLVHRLRSLGFSINETYETELYRREIKKGDVVLDIGAHIGGCTLIFAKLVGDEGKVFAFEPDPTNFAILKKNVKINGYKNVIMLQKAVSNQTGKTKLYLSKDNPADHRIYNSFDGRRSIEVKAIRLDDYFKNYDGKIDFIKMDIQGAEGGALQGMSLLLRKNKNVKIMTEFWPAGIKGFGIEPDRFLKLLMKHGFKLYHINEWERVIEQVSPAKLLQMYTIEKGNYTNLFCVR